MSRPPGPDAEVTVPLVFRVPDALHEIDLTEAPERRFQRTAALFCDVPGMTDAQALHLALNQERMLAELIKHGTIFAGLCCARSETRPGEVITAQFAIMVRPAILPAEQPLTVLAASLRTPGSPREVVVEKFPAGDAILIGEEVLLRASVTALGEPGTTEHRVRQAQVIFAFPDRRRTLTISMASENLDDWPYLIQILNGMVNSVSFIPPSDGHLTRILQPGTC